MNPELPHHLSVPGDVLFQDVAGEIVLLDLRSERYFSLDDVGARLWQLLAESGDPDRAVRCLLDEYDVDEPTLRRDIGVLVDRLVDAGLLTAESPRGS